MFIEILREYIKGNKVSIYLFIGIILTIIFYIMFICYVLHRYLILRRKYDDLYDAKIGCEALKEYYESGEETFSIDEVMEELGIK